MNVRVFFGRAFARISPVLAGACFGDPSAFLFPSLKKMGLNANLCPSGSISEAAFRDAAAIALRKEKSKR
jgi:hypothetical protein